MVQSSFSLIFLSCSHRWISPSCGLSTLDVKNTEKTMPQLGFTPKIPVLEQQKTVQALQHMEPQGYTRTFNVESGDEFPVAKLKPL